MSVQLSHAVKILVTRLRDETYQRLRGSDLGDRQFDTIMSSLADFMTREYNDFCKLLEASHFVKKCECFQQLIEKISIGDKEGAEEQAKNRANCRYCAGTGYKNIVTLHLAEDKILTSAYPTPDVGPPADEPKKVGNHTINSKRTISRRRVAGAGQKP